MKKNLLTLGLLALGLSVQAQNNVLLHVDDTAKFYVSDGTLVYNGGGLQTKGTGIIDNHGNIMVVGSANDALKTSDTSGNPLTTGNNIVLRLNDTNPANIATASYGQLYIDGIPQSNITGIVSKEFLAKRHGTGNYFQQIAMPFYGKVLNSLSTEFGKQFGNVRWSQNEILTWNNANVVSDHFTDIYTSTSNPTAYYMLGSNADNLNTQSPPSSMSTIAPTPTGAVFTIKGKPYTSLSNSEVLLNAGANVNFGTNGTATNQYREMYNTYLQDQFSYTTGTWAGDYGKNIYQYGNPFLTNLDLSRIGYNEGANGDGNALSSIWGVRYDPGTVYTTSQGSTYSVGALTQTFDSSGVPVGDVGLIIKPMQTFVLKMRNNTDTAAQRTLNFNTLRRFNSTVRSATTPYSVTAARNSNSGPINRNGQGTVKQLGVIAIDANGQEIGRTYYAVSPTFTTGHQTSSVSTVQASASSSNLIGTFEEALTGGYDYNYTSSYWLYINEANENDFLGKNVKLVNYDFGRNHLATSYKFEIRENGELVTPGTHLLSSGKGFYYRAGTGNVLPALQDGVVPILGDEYDLYYGEPGTNSTLGTQEIKKPSRTVVVYNPEIKDYIVRFDPNWKNADIQVFDMSGKLIISEKKVSTSKDFVIVLDGAIKNAYVVKIVADNGDVVNTKILK